jgi:3-oxoacyl-[acyl-carrier protein] reductase
VNSVAPGYTVTDMTRSTAERIGVSIDELTRDVVAGIAVGRAGHPEDIAHAVAYFCDERSGFVSPPAALRGRRAPRMTISDSPACQHSR